MKVFYFLAVFALITILSNFFPLPQHQAPESSGIYILNQIKSWSLGTMTLFSVVISVVSTALLLPKDVEDRTLYTILAKPVPRFDYLAGKLLGVLMLVFVSLALMDLLMIGVLKFRAENLWQAQVAKASSMGWGQDVLASIKQEIDMQGATWSLQAGVFAVFLRAVIIASLALFISTFSTSTLFTTIIGFLIYFIGNFQADAREFYLKSQGAEAFLAKCLSLVMTIFIPDFQMFNVIDAVIEGQQVALKAIGILSGVGLFYAVFFVFLSWFIFADKEF